jgi:hypothetical protein
MDMNFAQAIRKSFCPLCHDYGHCEPMDDFSSEHWVRAMKEAEEVCAQMGITPEQFVQYGVMYRTGGLPKTDPLWHVFKIYMDGPD